MGSAARPVVLLVDDDPSVLSALRRGLRREGIEIETARDASEALARLEREAVDLVVSDQKMPRTTGIELLKSVRARWPGTRRILLSGWTSEIAQADLDAADLFCVLSKPWDDAELRRSIRSAAGLEPGA